MDWKTRVKFNLTRLKLLSDFRASHLFSILADMLCAIFWWGEYPTVGNVFALGLPDLSWALIFTLMVIAQVTLIWVPLMNSKIAIVFAGVHAAIWVFLTFVIASVANLPFIYLVGPIILMLLAVWNFMRVGYIAPCEMYMGNGWYCPPLNEVRKIDWYPNSNVSIRHKRNYT